MNDQTLAIRGGAPVRTGPYPDRACFDDTELDGARRALDSGVLSGFVGTPGDHHFGGPEVRALERRWAQFGGYAAVVSVNSATAGLHVGLAGMDLPRGSEVVVPPYTMSATVAAVLMVGLRPRFADLDPDLFTLTAATVEEAIGPDTSAVLPVHLFGQMAPMGPLVELCRRRGLRMLEDAAQCPGATQDGAWPGHTSSGAIFSLNQNKVITCGEGGLLASDDCDVVERAQLVRNHAESVVHAYPQIPSAGMIGWNYRLTELSAAVADAQSAKLERLNAHRNRLADRLRARIGVVPGLAPPVTHPGNTHTYFSFAVRFDEDTWGCGRDAFVEALRAEGVPCAAGYVPPLYGLELFGERRDDTLDPGRFPVCERLARHELVLLSVCRWPATDDDIDDVADAVEKLWEHRRALS